MSDDPGRTREALDRVAARLLDASVYERVGIAVGSTGLALLIGLVVVAAAGHNPLLFAQQLVVGSVGSTGAFTRTLRFTTLFILAGVAVAVAFRAGVFNIGVQGQLVVGGIACVLSILWLAPFVPNGPVGGAGLTLVGLFAAVVAGGLYAALPGVLKAYYGANEIITTIMLNFIAIGIVGWAVDGPLRPDDARSVRTEYLPEGVGLPSLVFSDPNFSILGLGLALAVVGVVAVGMTRTSFGYDMVTSGYQASAATFSGVDPQRTIVATMTLSGMVAGLVGAVFAIMIQGYFIDPSGIGTYGFDAIAVSLLAANNPVGVVPASLLFGALESSGSHVQIHSDVPVQLIDGIVGIVVLFVAAPELFRMLAKRTGLGGEKR
ncbi:inner-membrane translocator [Natronococcus amylolyticus DSM 10524]|uniref:Inner-membrane translocator n=1 Tax=Natronococcus amylolyticus DSM 10524 TaxID=1227497 RepID=L9X0Y6_9EURY|nr:ABC transporter permease [Natronococcus amylolyticus]ELY55385.1 inner-membrane translocator [Natronococcus amylolyticus DSM 10524]